MAITSEDIQNQSFSIDRKGYDVDEVDVFLEHVADEIDALNARIAELESGADFEEVNDPFAPSAIEETIDEAPEAAYTDEDLNERDQRIQELENQLREKKANDSAISQALIIAQRTADDTIARAEVQADQIIADANDRADDIIARANATKQEIITETKQLDDDCEAMRDKFQDILKDFINDATNKLADISDANLMTSAHARRSNYEAELADASAKVAAASAKDYVTPTFGGSVTQATTAMPMSSMAGDRDLSGFGDASVDEFDIDD